MEAALGISPDAGTHIGLRPRFVWEEMVRVHM
jgi:hypothetical protein